MSEITLKRFNVRLVEWGDTKGTYECSAEFSTKGMDFTIDIPHDLGDALVAICKGKIATASENALSHLVLLSKEQLEEK
jgi:hypothetical protein